jgi:HK97 family phage prohead protease
MRMHNAMKSFAVAGRSLGRLVAIAAAASAIPPTLPAPQQRSKRVRVIDAVLGLAEGDKAFETVKDGDKVVDFANVRIAGYLSTWGDGTTRDLDGDYVLKGAFAATIPDFMRNPVLLVCHDNSVETLAGSFTVVREDDKGLYVEAVLSNSPSEDMKDIRWKVAEGHLKSLSMGGLFYYLADGKGIAKVDLYEGSLTPVPVNGSARFSVRDMTPREAKAHENFAANRQQ